MGDTEASIQLKLVTNAYMSAMKQLENQSGQSVKRMGSTFQQSMEAGAQGGISAVKGLFSTIRSGVGVVTGLLGGIGFGALVKGAIDSQSQFRNLQFAIQAGSGQLVKWQTLQKDAQATALKWGQQSDALGRSLETVFADTTNLEFAQKAVETIAVTARGTGADIDQLSRIAGVLNQKFGVTAEELPDAMAQVVTAAQGLGPQALEKLGDDFGEIGGKAKTMGLQGTAAVTSMLGWLTKAKMESGRFEQAMTALPQIFDQIIERTSGGQVTSGGRIPIKVAAVDAQGKPRAPEAIIADIIAKTGGDATKLGEFGFGGEGLQTVLALAKDFQAELKGTGGNVESASAFVQEQLRDAAGSAIEFSEIQKRAAENVKGPAAGIDRATELLQQAFTKPEMMSAIEQLAQQLPKLAEGIASMLDIVLDNPLLAGGGVIAGTALKGGLQATLSQAFSSGGQTAASSIQNALTTGGKNAGTSIAGGFAGTLAFTAAIGAWTVALDQANKLRKDLNTREKDIKDEQLNALNIAEKRGKSFAIRQRAPSETLFGGEEEEVVFREKGGQVRVLPKSEFEEAMQPTQTLGGGAGGGGAAEEVRRLQQAGVGGAGAYIPPQIELAEPAVPFPYAGPLTEEGQTMRELFPTAATNPELFGAQEDVAAAVRDTGDRQVQAVQQLPQQELRVRITNPEDIKAGPSATTGTVTPGNQPRP